MRNFNDFGLRDAILKILIKNNFITPTPIQSKAIPFAMDGRDIIATAQTGTGKTLAFGVPLISHLLNNIDDCGLVMVPTRELAAQVAEMLKKIIDPKTDLKPTLLVGGESISQQIMQLRKYKSRIVVGTPGRINDHIQRRSLNLSNTRFLVLDETDRMLDMGFSIAIDKILQYLPQKRQTLMFSATIPSSALNLSKKYLIDPVQISIEPTNSQANLITQENIKIAESDKYNTLLIQLDKREGSIIVFVKTKINVDKMAKKLQLLNHGVVAIHGDLRQSKRNSVIKSFREGKNRIMVATDVAARGLDIPHIEHVINYDLPHCAEDYVHRIGRTGRAGASGFALNLISPSDERKWYAIDKMLNPTSSNAKDKSGRSVKNNQKNKFGDRLGDRYKNNRAEYTKDSPNKNHKLGYAPKNKSKYNLENNSAEKKQKTFSLFKDYDSNDNKKYNDRKKLNNKSFNYGISGISSYKSHEPKKINHKTGKNRF